MQLERCNVVPRACSQVEFFGTGCVGCVITAKVIIDQGIYNVMLFTCLWKNAWEPGNACKKTEKLMFFVNNEKLYHWLIGHSTETYIKSLMKDLWNGKHFLKMRIGSTCRSVVHHESHIRLLYHRMEQRFLQGSLCVTNYSLKWKCSYSLMKLSAQIRHKSPSVVFCPFNHYSVWVPCFLCAQQTC